MPRGRWHRSPHVACRLYLYLYLYLYLPTFPSSEKVPVLTKEGKAETVNELLNTYTDDNQSHGIVGLRYANPTYIA